MEWLIEFWHVWGIGGVLVGVLLFIVYRLVIHLVTKTYQERINIETELKNKIEVLFEEIKTEREKILHIESSQSNQKQILEMQHQEMSKLISNLNQMTTVFNKLNTTLEKNQHTQDKLVELLTDKIKLL